MLKEKDKEATMTLQGTIFCKNLSLIASAQLVRFIFAKTDIKDQSLFKKKK